MCDAYPKKPKRDRRPRVVVDLSPESADALRGWAKSRMMQVRHAPARMARLIAMHDSHVQQMTFNLNQANAVKDASEAQRTKERRDYREAVADLQSEIANLQSELAASEEARGGADLSPESLDVLRAHATKHNVMVRDAALDLARLLENRETLLFQVNGNLGAALDKLAASEEARGLALEQAETCRRQIVECEGLRRAAVERANKLSRDLTRLHQMTAWDHVRAAAGKRPVVSAVIGAAGAWCIGCGAAVAHMMIRGML